MSTFPACCDPVGTGGDNVVHTVRNVGGGVESYVIGTGPNPFDLRTFESSDASVGIVQTATTIDLTVDAGDLVSLANVGGFVEVFVDPSGPNPFNLRTLQSSDSTVDVSQNANDIDFAVDAADLVSLANVGAGAEVWVDPSGPDPFNLRSVRSPNATVTVVQTATEIQLEVPTPAAGTPVFQVDSTASKSTTLTTYQLVTTLATDPDSQIADGETWKINLCILVCHPVNVFTVNTFVKWSIETAAGVFTQLDEWQINAPITISGGEPSMPFHRTINTVIAFDDPRMRVEVKMSAVQASATLVEDPRWGGVRISEAP